MADASNIAPPATSDVPEDRSGDTSVEAKVEVAHEAVLDHQRAYVAAVREGILIPLRETLAAAADAHATAHAALAGLDAWMDPDASLDVVAEGVRAYRRTTDAAVFDPLRERLRFVDVGAVLRGARSTLEDARRKLADEMPDAQTRPEPSGLYDPGPGDSSWTSFRKFAVRSRRKAAGWVGRDASPRKTVPTADLVRYHAEQRMADAEAEPIRAMEQELARWTDRLERAATQWTHAALDAETVSDVPLRDRTPPSESDPDSEKIGDAEATASESDEPGASDSKPAEESPPDDAPPEEAPSEDAPPEDADAPRRSRADQARARLEALVRAATQLHAVLADGIELSAASLSDEMVARADAARAELEADARHAGTFMAAPRTDAGRGERRVRSARRKRTAGWVEWHRQAVERLAFLKAITGIRDAVWSQQQTLAADLVEVSLVPVQVILADGVERLRAVRDEVDRLLVTPDPGAERRTATRLDRQLDAALDVVEHDVAEALRQTAVRRQTEEVLDAHVEAVREAARVQAETYTLHDLPEEGERLGPDAPVHTVQWRSVVKETVDVLLFDAWRAVLPPLAGAVDTAIETAVEVEGIVRFNVAAAIEELHDLAASRRRGDGDGDHVGAARELALDGLDRAAAAIDAARGPLSDAAAPLTDTLQRSTAEAWARVHDRARAAGRARGQVLRAQARAEAYLRAATGWGEATAREVQVRLRRALSLGRHRLEQVVRLGQSAVGTGQVDEGTLRQTVTALATVESELEDMPRVYRRLFSFRPLRDPDLLVGRMGDLKHVEGHLEQWKAGRSSAMVLTGDPGGGLTSLVNVLGSTTFRRARRHTVELSTRYASEAEIAAHVARSLGVKVDPTREDSLTFDAVVETLREAPDPSRVRVAFVEHLEHLFLRTVGGTRFLGQMLEFMSKTADRILWVGTMSDFGWQVIEKHEPESVGLVVRHALDRFDREELEEVIACRHRRSGLQLVFETPAETTQPLLARRLARADSEAERQRLIRADYFDRLYTLCGQNVMLALLYWFRSVSLTDDGTTVRVAPLRPIRFEFLDDFSLQRSFALKALLEHATLTIDELAEVLQISKAASRTLLESLGNAHLIASAEMAGLSATVTVNVVRPDVRYRIRPLVLHPVVRHLRTRNIVH